ncbi:hypothetical protein M5689_018211 [Euphorbia peplus]|nr:hypothetical protein M5689_018211 [Euphorbia peplus]
MPTWMMILRISDIQWRIVQLSSILALLRVLSRMEEITSNTSIKERRSTIPNHLKALKTMIHGSPALRSGTKVLALMKKTTPTWRKCS